MKKLLLGLGRQLSGTVEFTGAHGGSDEGGARGTEPDIRLSLRDGLAPGAVLCRYGSCRTGAGCAGSPPGQLISLCKTELSLPDGLCLMAGGVFFGSVNS